MKYYTLKPGVIGFTSTPIRSGIIYSDDIPYIKSLVEKFPNEWEEIINIDEYQNFPRRSALIQNYETKTFKFGK